VGEKGQSGRDMSEWLIVVGVPWVMPLLLLSLSFFVGHVVTIFLRGSHYYCCQSLMCVVCLPLL